MNNFLIKIIEENSDQFKFSHSVIWSIPGIRWINSIQSGVIFLTVHLSTP